MLLVKLHSLPRQSNFACKGTSHPAADLRCSVQCDLGLLWLQISDAGADVLLDALPMDRNMVLLDMSANQLTMKRCALSLLDGRAFSMGALSLLDGNQGRLVKVCLHSLLFDVHVAECMMR